MSISYQPGDWLMFVAATGVVAVPRVSADRITAPLWSLLGQGQPELPQLIDLLSGGSVAGVGSFAVLLPGAEGTRVALRGPVRVVARVADKGEETISAAGVSTWTERVITGSASLEARFDSGKSPSYWLPVDAGVVFAGALRWVAAGSLSPATDDQSNADDQAAVTDPAVVDDAPAEPAPTNDAAPPQLQAAPDPAQPAPSLTAPPNLADTVYSPRPGALPLPPADQLAPPAVRGDHDGRTVSIHDLRRDQPTPDPSVPPTPINQSSASIGRVRLSTGQVVSLDRPVIIGRRPSSTRDGAADRPHLIVVESPNKDISRSHLQIRAEGDAALITDLQTTNGSTLLRGGAEPVRLQPGEPTPVGDGDVVDLGDGVTLVFEGLARDPGRRRRR